MNPIFNEDFTGPSHSFYAALPFQRIYHNQYLNATRSPRYRYKITEVRNYLDLTVLKGSVFLDGQPLSNFLRIESRAARLNELVREKNRFLREQIQAEITLPEGSGLKEAQAIVKMHYDRWINAFQVEIWDTLEPPLTSRHDYSVLDMMGYQGQITRVPDFSPFLQELENLKVVQLKFIENDRDLLSRSRIADPAVDDNYGSARSNLSRHPEKGEPWLDKYNVEFRYAWHLQIDKIEPLKYENDMMGQDNPGFRADNTLDKRWLLQYQLGGSLVFFNEICLPAGHQEGTHCHNGTEIIYCFYEGNGIAYLGKNDDPDMAHMDEVEQDVFRLGREKCKKLPVERGTVIFIKSGGTIGVHNTGKEDLRYLTYMYYTA